MWHVIYLSLFNLAVSVGVAYALKRRAAWVERQLRLGYDFVAVFPPSRFRLTRSKTVNIGKLCDVIQGKNQTATTQATSTGAAPPLVENAADNPAHPNVAETVAAESKPNPGPANETDAGTIDPPGTSTKIASDPESVPTKQPSLDSANPALSNAAGLPEGNRLAPSPDIEGQDPAEAGRAADPATAGTAADPSTATAANVASDGTTGLASDQEKNDATATATDRLSSESKLASGDRSDSNLAALNGESLDSKPAAADDRSSMEVIDLARDSEGDAAETPPSAAKDAEEKELSGDFLERISTIETALRRGLTPAAGLGQGELRRNLDHLDATAKYWASFADSTRILLEKKQLKPEQSELSRRTHAALQALDGQVDHFQKQAATLREHAEINSASDSDSASDGLGLGAGGLQSLQELRKTILKSAADSHALRDAMNGLFPNQSVPLHRAGNGKTLENYSEGLAGFKQVVETWKTLSEVDGNVAAALGLMDIGGIARLNDQFGLSQVDELLTGCSRQISQSIRHHRGYDRLIRLGGQQYLVFFGFTAGTDARFAIERIRQKFARSEFSIADRNVQVQLCGAVSSFDSQSTLIQQVEHLRQGIVLAKSSGGNQVWVADPDGSFKLVDDAPDYQLPETTVSLI